MKKDNRHSAITQIIKSLAIETQEQLQDELKKAGFDVTQATVSRDIKDLRIIKTNVNGKYQYTVPGVKFSGGGVLSLADSPIVSDNVTSSDSAQNMVVIKCYAGMAQAVCSLIDASADDAIVGSLAGDDTIFLVMRTTEDATRLSEIFKSFIR